MAVTQTTGRVTIKGKYRDGADIKNTTIATFSGINLSNVNISDFKNTVSSIAGAAQDCVSATVTGFTFSYEGADVDGYGAPGDELEAAEIFNEDFSDTNVIPTLQLVNMNEAGKTKNFNFKYMADPIDTQNFNTKVETLADRVGQLRFFEGGDFDTFVRGDMTFTAKDTVVQPD